MLKEKIHIVNSSLMDAHSKKIFENRVMFSLTKDFQYIMNLQNKNYFQRDCEYIIWGRGYWAKEIITCYPGIKWLAICDNNLAGEEKEFEGIRVITPSQLEQNYRHCKIVIATRKYWREIVDQLAGMGFGSDSIVNMGHEQEMLAESIYFDLPYLKNTGTEVFVDGGCYDGQTIDGFVKWAGGKYKKIFAFEPDSNNVGKCEAFIRRNRLEHVEVCNCALTDKSKELRFNAEGSALSGADENGSTIVRGGSLQEYVGEEHVSFIKLDIEGMELEALRGMEQIIKKDKPKMAVSVYHKEQDIWEIPLLLLEFNPDYRFYLRHYSLGLVDTVLYAVDPLQK